MSASSLQTLEADTATSAESVTTGLPKSKRRRVSRCAQRGQQHRTLYHALAAFASGAWGRLVERTHDRSVASTLYERRLKLMVLETCSTEHRAMESLEAGPVFCHVNSATILHAPAACDTRAKARPIEKERPVGAAVFISTAVPMGSSEVKLHIALDRLRKCLARNLVPDGGMALRAAWVQTASRLGDSQLKDVVRGNARVGLGWAEMPCEKASHFSGRPQEPASCGGMWYPRISAPHARGGAAILNIWMPLFSAALEVVRELPCGPGGRRSVVDDLQATVGSLCFPHEVEVVHDNDGRPRLQPVHAEHRLAASCMHRASFLLAQGKVATEETVAACPHLAPDQVRSLINRHGKTLCHVDPRDAGTEARLLGGEAAAGAGVEIVACVTADEPNDEWAEFMQTVVVIYSGCSEQEALAIVGLSSGELSAIFYAPKTDKGICMAIYLLDFSKRYHGNPSASHELPPEAWAFRSTPYATTHGATWAERILKLPPPRARLLLRSLAVLEGGVRLGTGSRESFPSSENESTAGQEELEEGEIYEGQAVGGILEGQGEVLGAFEQVAVPPPPPPPPGRVPPPPPPPCHVSTRSVTRASAHGLVDGPLGAEEVEEGHEPSYSREAAELCGSTVVMEGREGLVQRSSCNGHLDRYWVVCAERKWRPLDPSLATVVRRHEEVTNTNTNAAMAEAAEAAKAKVQVKGQAEKRGRGSDMMTRLSTLRPRPKWCTACSLAGKPAQGCKCVRGQMVRVWDRAGMDVGEVIGVEIALNVAECAVTIQYDGMPKTVRVGLGVYKWELVIS